MALPKSKTKESNYQVVETARILRKKVLDACLKLPRRYTFLLLQDTMHVANDVMHLCKSANSVFPTNPSEVQMRINYWIQARASLQALSSDIDEIAEIPSILTYSFTGKKKGVTRHEIDELGALINKEMGLIKKAIEVDRKRFRQ